MKINIYNIQFVLLVSLVTRLVVFYLYSDTAIDNEWGYLIHNLSSSGVLGINVVDGDIIKIAYAEENQKVLPSVFMPPLYAYFIYVIKILIGNLIYLVNAVIFFQIFISLFSILIFFRLFKFFFSSKLSLLFSFIYSIIPINIYAPTQISSITIQIFLILLYFFYFNRCLINKSNFELVKLSLIGGLLILTRGEFLLFHFFTFCYLIFLKKIYLKEGLIFIFFSLIIIFPYLTRNYLTFNEIVLTKSFGYNLLKGNNPISNSEGNADFIEKNFSEKIKFIKIDDRYEINIDNFYKRVAIEYVKDEPINYLKKYLLKLFSFLFIDLGSTYPNYFSVLHIFPKIVLSILTFFSTIFFLKEKSFFNYLSLFYFGNAIFFSFFFILPRYNVVLIPLQLLLIANFYHSFFLKKLRKNFY